MSNNTSTSPQDSTMSSTQNEPAYDPTTKNDILKDQDQEHPFEAPNTDAIAPLQNSKIDQNNPKPEDQLSNHQSTASNDTQTPCYTTCRAPTSTDIITCANPTCPRQHFHLPCTRLKEPPSAADNWRCTLCTGWQAVLDRDPDDPGDDVWRCPKCLEEVVDEDEGDGSNDEDENDECGGDDESEWCGHEGESDWCSDMDEGGGFGGEKESYGFSNEEVSESDGSRNDGQLSQEPLGCEACDLVAGEPWEPRGEDEWPSFQAELAKYRAALAAKVKLENEVRNERALARGRRGL